MWDKIIGAVVAIAAGIFAGVVIYELYVAYINFQKALEIARSKSNSITKKVNRAIISQIDRGNVNVIRIGLFGSNEKVAEIQIKSNQIDSDLSQGTILFNE